ncbi:hypothetical protein P4S64_14960 [Vibrio sp. M60_M31a]
MAKIIKVKTGSRFEEIASYSRAVTVDNWIFAPPTLREETRNQRNARRCVRAN